MAVRSTKTPAAPTAGGGTPAREPALVPHGAHAGKPALPLHRPLILIGSRQRAHVHLISNSVSRVHAVIINTDHGSYVRDLASRTGTIVNGRHVKEAGLRHSDTIQVGTFQFKFSDPTGRGPLAAATRAPAAVLHLPDRGPLPLEARTVLIGQRDSCDIALHSAAVSTAHALIFELNGRHFVRDLGSRTGTFINGRQVHQEALDVGDMIRVGETAIRYASAASSEPADVTGEVEEPLEVAEQQEAVAPPAVTAAAEPVGAESTPATEFPDLGFAAEVGGVEPLPVAEAEVPAAPRPTPAAEPPAIAATTHAGFEPEALPLADEPSPAATPTPQGRDDTFATAEELFGPTGQSDLALDLSAPQPEPPLPLPDPEPAVAEVESLPPLPGDDAAAPEPFPVAEEPPPVTPAESPLEPEIDFGPEPQTVASVVNEPFGPLTDLNLLKDVEPVPELEVEPSMLDEIELPPATRATQDVAPAEPPPPVATGPAVEPEPFVEPQPEPQSAQPELEAPPIELEPAAIEPEPVALEPDRAAIEPEPVVLEPEHAAIEPEPEPLESLAEVAPPEAETFEVSPAGEASGTVGAEVPETIPDVTAEPLADHKSPAWSAPETVATFEPAVPDVAPEATAAEASHGQRLQPVAETPPLEPAAPEAAVDLPPAVADLEDLVVPAPAPEVTPLEVSATAPTDLNLAVAAEAAVSDEPAPQPGEAPAIEAVALEAPAAEEPPAEATAQVAEGIPPASVEESPVIEESSVEELPPAAPVVDEEPTKPAAKKRTRKPAAKRAAPPPPAEPGAPKKRRWWGKKAKEAAEAAAAAAAAETGALGDATTDATDTASETLSAAAEIPGAAAPDAVTDTVPPPVEDVAPQDLATAASVTDVGTDAAITGEAVAPVADLSATAAEPEAPPAETLAPTEPSPESALPLDEPALEGEALVAGGGLADDVSMTTSEAPPEPTPSDPAFDALLEEFAGPSTGPIVERREEAREQLPNEPGFATAASNEPGPAAAASEPAVQAGVADVQATIPDEIPDVPPLPPMPLGGVPAPLLDSDPHAPRQPVDAAAPPEPPPWEEPVRREEPSSPPAFDDRIPDPLDFPPAPPVEAPRAEEPAPPPVPPPPARPTPAFNPFRGMGRDAGSFIGGLPLNLPPDPFGTFGPPPMVPPADEPGRAPASAEARSTAAPVEPLMPVAQPGKHPELNLDEMPEPALDLDYPAAQPDAPAVSPASEATVPPLALESEFDPLSPLPPPPTATSGGSDLDLSLPDLSLGDLPEPPPAPSATTSEGLLDPVSLDLPELGTPAEAPPAKAGGRADEEIDPLLFTEAEAPTLHMLPKPSPGPARPPHKPPRQQVQPPPARGPAARGNYPPTPPPPARTTRPRRVAPRAPLDLPASDLEAALGIPAVGTPAAPAAPAAPGAPPAKPEGAHAFDGLALSRVREADVFSGLPLGSDDAILGGSRPGAARPAHKRRGREVAPLAAPDELLAPLPGTDPGPLSPMAPLPPLGKPVRPAAQTADASAGSPPHAAGRPERGAKGAPRRRVNLGLWLVLMLATLAAASAGIWFFGRRPGAEVVATLQFDRLRDLGELQRKQFEQVQKDWLARPDFRGQAREILLVSHAGVTPGFLGEDDQAVAAYDLIVRNAHVKERSGSLTLPHRGTDPDGDRARMEALVKALHAQNKTRGDLAATLQAQYDKAQKDLAGLSERINNARQRAAALQGKADAVQQLEGKLQAAQAEDAKLRAAAAEARREVDRLRAELERARRSGPAPRPAGAEGAAQQSAAGGGAPVALISTELAPVDTDPQLRQWTEQLQRMTDADAAAVRQHASRLAAAAKALDQAMEDFGGALKRLLAKRAEPQLRAAWEADDELRRLEQELALKRRHHNAAAGGGLRDEAAALEAEVSDLARRVERRREELVADTDYGRRTRALRELIDASRSLSGEQRVRHDEAAMTQLADWVAEARGGEDAPAGDLERAARALKSAREAFATAAVAAPAGDATAAADLKQRIAARRVLLAAQDAEQDVQAAAIERLNKDLAAARKREAEAVAAADRSAETVRQLKADLADARQAATGVADAHRTLQGLEAQHKKVLADADDRKKQLAQAVVPVEPGPDAVSVAPAGQDPRPWWILFADAAIVFFFGVLVWLTAQGGHGPALPDRANPFDAPVVGAEPPDPNPDDERPVAV